MYVALFVRLGSKQPITKQKGLYNIMLHRPLIISISFNYISFKMGREGFEPPRVRL